MWASRTRTISGLVGQCSRCRYAPNASRPTFTGLAPLKARSRLISTPASSPYQILDQTYKRDTYSNTPPAILSKIDRQLLHHPSHPLSILRNIIESHFSTHTSLTPSSPIVSVWQNFDELGFPPDHPGRSLTDSYYLNQEYMLRTHTSAHEVETYRKGLDRWLISADVYRRDEIDASHYPVFHQMEGTHIWPSSDISQIKDLNAKLEEELASCPLIIEDNTTISATNPYQPTHDPALAEEITKHLKHSLNSLIYRLFGSQQMEGEPLRVRWIEAFFPFTSPSYEVEVWWNGEWLELLGCGVVQQKTLDQAGEPTGLAGALDIADPRSIAQSRLGLRAGSGTNSNGPIQYPRYPLILVIRRPIFIPIQVGANKSIPTLFKIPTLLQRYVILVTPYPHFQRDCRGKGKGIPRE